MIKVFECLGVQTFEKDGKKELIYIIVSRLMILKRIVQVSSVTTYLPTRILRYQNLVKDSRLYIRLALTLRTSVIYRSLRSSTLFLSINSVNYLYWYLHNIAAGLRFGSSP